MSSFEIGASRPVSAIQVKTVAPTPAAQAPATVQAPVASSSAAQVETSDAVKAGDAPVDVERVKTIRHAIETGTYPVIPTKIADAMIAAGMLLRNPQ
jgi:negative regulator of flagellin synthesis FlgM